MKANGGLITLDDLKAYQAKERTPVRGTYRSYDIISMPPTSTGGTLLVEMLNMLERFNVAAMGHNSSAKYHVLIEVMRRGYADRARRFGDPDFVKVPVAELTSKAYAARLAKTIDPNRATPSPSIRKGGELFNESMETTHFSVVDSMGNAVANTYTLENAFGSGVTVRGTGFLLNNEMNDFTAKPGVPTEDGLFQSEVDAVAPGKRPVSSTTSTIILKDGRLFAVLGSPGGPTIPTQMLQVLSNIIDHEMNLKEAVTAPRIHHQWRRLFPGHTIGCDSPVGSITTGWTAKRGLFLQIGCLKSLLSAPDCAVARLAWLATKRKWTHTWRTMAFLVPNQLSPTHDQFVI